MTMPAAKPMVLAVVPEAISSFLKGLHQWVVWRAKIKPDGRIDKVPIGPTTGQAVNAQDRRHHLSFKKALTAYNAGKGSGLGFVLNGEPVDNNYGEPLYLIGGDLDKINASPEAADRAAQLLKPIRGVYLETSPSGAGYRFFCLSRHKPRSGQGKGCELYAKGRFLTVTGQNVLGSIRDCTAGVQAVERLLWPDSPPSNSKLDPSASCKTKTNNPKGLRYITIVEDTPRQRARLSGMLVCISADCDYERYRDVLWGIMSLDWHDTEEMARDWCMTAPHRFDESNFTALINSHHQERTPTIGTLIYLARKGGWND